MLASIILHNMILEAKQDENESEVWSLIYDAAETRFHLDENGPEK